MQKVEYGAGGREGMAAAARRAACGWLRERRVSELVAGKRRLVEVPCTATLAHTMNVLVANGVVAVAVAAPPGRWIGAGGSMILESDPTTGVVRKQYIGLVTMLDILVHLAEEEGEHVVISSPTSGRRTGSASPTVAAAAAANAGDGGGFDLYRRMSVPVSSIIGHSLEGLSLWTLNPNTSILDCMETFSKGIHRALVPLESHTDHVIAVELNEASPGYRMLTQMDVLGFLRLHAKELKDIISCSVGELGAISENVFSITKHTKVIDAIKSMRSAALLAVPIVEPFEDFEDNHMLLDREARKLVGTFSATDLRGCPIDLLQSWLSIGVAEFKEKASRRCNPPRDAPENLVTCFPETSLAEVIEEAVVRHVHRVWVVDGKGLLTGIISLTDMLRVIRASLLSAEQEP